MFVPQVLPLPKFASVAFGRAQCLPAAQAIIISCQASPVAHLKDESSWIRERNTRRANRLYFRAICPVCTTSLHMHLHPYQPLRVFSLSIACFSFAPGKSSDPLTNLNSRITELKKVWKLLWRLISVVWSSQMLPNTWNNTGLLLLSDH
jgi:hypothetical protein